MGTPTHCPYCALQCGMALHDENGTGTVRVTPREDVPANGGGLCQKGWTAAELLTVPDRLTAPLMRRRRDAPLEPCTWDEALDRITAGIGRLRALHGPDAVAVFGGGGLTNEKAYQLGKFARVALGTSQIDYNGRFCMSSAAAASGRAFGMDRGLPGPVTDLAASGAVLLAGGNPAETMPPFMRHLNEMRDDGGALIVVDPRRTATARQADLHLRPTPGTDIALANGLLHLALAEGLADEEYIAARTTGFDAVRTVVNAYWPERAERITGVPVPLMREAVRLLARARRAHVLTARGSEQHARGTDMVTGFINLALALGLPGREGSGYGCLTGQGNGQGGREHGQKADQLPGYRRIDDPAARAHVAGVWGVDPDDLPGPGRSAYELLSALGTAGGPKALLVFGSNPVVSAPAAADVEERLGALDLLVVADFVPSETARRADVVLPAAQWAEESGTMTNLEGRVLRRRRAVRPPDGVRTDLEILGALAERLKAPGEWSTDPEEVFGELRRAGAGGIADYSGITYDRIEAEGGVFWPCPSPDHPGTPRPYLDRFPTPDGRARFVPVEHTGAAEDVDADYPVYLTTGRVLAQYQSGAQTRRVRPLAEAAPGPFVELHPDLAARLGIEDGAAVRLESRRGAATVAARLTDAIRDDTVFIPFHWAGEGRANLLTNPALDPVSRMPEFKVCAVRLTPVHRGGTPPHPRSASGARQ
ncbi:nitrite reductase [Actinomadura darangshiensis]|uniref:Nitrite reductase n=1 Tax=Actinomadura darangshiensis TaxID=705336 RepID=A0A4R5AUA9_9ACTN|nr:molybdopterin-dependent oxidoreductase [Actinomadura darangshiensis]TDD76611.1 nitrite reductase [Actinomadura darangshiensis]